jgi:hypothetical protein
MVRFVWAAAGGGHRKSDSAGDDLKYDLDSHCAASERYYCAQVWTAIALLDAVMHRKTENMTEREHCFNL